VRILCTSFTLLKDRDGSKIFFYLVTGENTKLFFCLVSGQVRIISFSFTLLEDR
jgi:hypothetical protein